MSRIVIPNNFLKQDKLFKDIYEKHVSLGVNSPLKDYDVAGITVKMSEADLSRRLRGKKQTGRGFV